MAEQKNKLTDSGKKLPRTIDVDQEKIITNEKMSANEEAIDKTEDQEACNNKPVKIKKAFSSENPCGNVSQNQNRRSGL